MPFCKPGNTSTSSNGFGLPCQSLFYYFFFFQAEDGIRDPLVTGVQTCALPISAGLAWALAISPARAAAAPAAACPATLQYTFPRLQDEKPQALCQYTGRVLLVVNTASYCSFTPQYEGLEALYSKYKDRGLVVLGFPSNDFAQETGDNRQIADFCQNTYGVKFPMFA